MARLDLAASSLFMFDCWMNFRAAYVGKSVKVAEPHLADDDALAHCSTNAVIQLA
jgi:hypothetical protein